MAFNMDHSSMTLGQLLSALELPESVAQISIVGLSIDSRDIRSGYVFVAMQGVNIHGREFIPAAIGQGAVAVFIESNDKQVTIEYQQEVPVIAIPYLEYILSDIAGGFYGHPTKTLPVVGITGTNGKTTCSQLYAQLSALMGQVSGVVGTMGYGCCSLTSNSDIKTDLPLTSTGMTTPDAINTQAICAELVAAGSHDLVMEVSSHGLQQGRVSAIDIDTAIFTNLTHDHLDYHGDMTAYGAAKARLFAMPSLSSAVINIDDPFAEKLIQTMDPSVRVVTYSVSNPLADLFLSDINYCSSATQAVLQTQMGSYSLSTHLVGAFNLSNLLAVLGVFYSRNNQTEFTHALAKVAFLQSVSGRMELIPNAVNRQVIVDFAHTPDALENVLLSVNEYSDASVWCVFGCGGDRDTVKRSLMASVAEKYAHHVIVTSDNPRNENPQLIVDDIVEGFEHDHYQVILDRKQAITAAINQSSVNDIIIIAGKGHEDYQQIGDKKFPFSDQQVARLALRDMEANQ